LENPVAYLVIALIAAVLLVALVLIGAKRLGSSSIRIRGSLVRLFDFEISLDRASDPGAPARDLPAPGRHASPLDP
jgi:hypothetical protein